MKSNQSQVKQEIQLDDISLESINEDKNKEITQQIVELSANTIEQFEQILDNDFVNELPTIDVVDKWEVEFTKRIKQESRSKKVKYTIEDALLNTTLHSARDNCFIEAYNYLKANPPQRNHIIKYLTAYNEKDIKFKERHFIFDLKILKKYYEKTDEKKKNGISYNPFNIKAYRNYVIYMVLKLGGEYLDSDDVFFKVTFKDSREYNPATKIPSILRGFLPIDIKEYDIKRAFPTFIDMELGTDYRHTIYDTLDKKTFAQLLNANSPQRNFSSDYYYHTSNEELKKVYGNRSEEVLTPERFSEKGKAFRDFTKYEINFIEQFIKENNICTYVRLHDALILNQSQMIAKKTFGIVEFGTKKIAIPEKNPDALETFYYMDHEGNFKITPVSVRNCLINLGIKRISTPDDSTLLILDNNNVIDPFNHKTDLLDKLKEEINELDEDYEKIENLIALEYKNTIMKALPLIKPHKLIFYQDTEYTFGLPFKNGFFLMGKDGTITNQDYNTQKGFFRKHVIQSKEFEYTEDVGDFEKFNKNVAGEHEKAFMTMIGFFAHSYKDPACCPCIILTDEGADDIKRDGGRGKTIFISAFAQILTILKKGGLEFDPNYTHVFADLEKGTKGYVIDDVPAGFYFEALYTNISGDISCQRKGTKAETIDFSESPKFIITSNWVIPYSSDNTSTNRRFAEYKLKKHYDINFTPINEFGKRFFIDWDTNEFNRFYSFIFRCVRLFFSEGLITPVYDKELDTFLVKFRNDAFLQEFERILKPLLKTRKTFTATDFLLEYSHFENPFKNNKWFHQNNVRNLIDVWLKYNYNVSNYKYWNYSKSNKAWVYNSENLSVKSIIEGEKYMDDMVAKFTINN